MTYRAPLWNYAQCANELVYLTSINPAAPGATFNHDRLTFARYANMQANHMFASGESALAWEALQIRDTACPTFRSEMRAAGWHVEGIYAFETRAAWDAVYAAHRRATNRQWERVTS